jgi:hypothetical protein
MIEPIDCLARNFGLFYRIEQAHIASHEWGGQAVVSGQ